MKAITPNELKADIYNLLDEVLETGIPLAIKRGNKKMIIISAEKANRPQRLIFSPVVIRGDSEKLVQINWVEGLNLDLP